MGEYRLPFIGNTNRHRNLFGTYSILELCGEGYTPRQGVKHYSTGDDGRMELTGALPRRITGRPDPRHISTSYAERNNLNCRTFMRRLTRLTNGYSKKLENLISALWLYFAHYNFVRIHGTLRMTPAMAANVTDHLWTIEELLNTGA